MVWDVDILLHICGIGDAISSWGSEGHAVRMMWSYMVLLLDLVLLRMLRLDACVVVEKGSFGVAMCERGVWVSGMWERILLRGSTGC
jgi:hypothetical protein